MKMCSLDLMAKIHAIYTRLSDGSKLIIIAMNNHTMLHLIDMSK